MAGYRGKIIAAPIDQDAASVQWDCPHRHRYEVAAAECANGEARRRFIPAPDRQRRARAKWRTVTITIEELEGPWPS
jgi:hypothetical protein